MWYIHLQSKPSLLSTGCHQTNILQVYSSGHLNLVCIHHNRHTGRSPMSWCIDVDKSAPMHIRWYLISDKVRKMKSPIYYNKLNYNQFTSIYIFTIVLNFTKHNLHLLMAQKCMEFIASLDNRVNKISDRSQTFSEWVPSNLLNLTWELIIWLFWTILMNLFEV